MFKPKPMYDCCVCGKGFRMAELNEIDPNSVDTKLSRHLNTNLCELYLCKRCKSKCRQCNAVIPYVQYKTAYEKCAVCNLSNESKRRRLV
jgi:hypothetical protein